MIFSTGWLILNIKITFLFIYTTKVVSGIVYIYMYLYFEL